MKRRILYILLIGVWVGGCGADRTKVDALAVQNVIQRYNQLLRDGYSRMDMTPLQQVATEAQAAKVYHHMSALGSSKIRMESELADIQFLDIEFLERNKARVMTRERWNYTHMNIDTKIPGQTVVEGLVYDLSYELVRRDKEWLVSSVSVLRDKERQNVSKNDSLQ